MNGVVIQVPVSVGLRTQATESAVAQGFSSLQEAIRIFLANLAAHKITISFAQSVSLSAKNDRRYAKMLKEINDGKVATKNFSDAASLMDYLNS
ncbi:hypothetical protein HY085_00540 [Candidatus Gottesmanbacteria bacterium]|nr:hypothetical protein [Candidatus Gottesmanbacteria bacterium]